MRSLTRTLGLLLLFLCIHPCSSRAAKVIDWQYTSVDDLNLFNKLVPTVRPFARFDLSMFEHLNYRERNQCLECSGLAVAFNTDSPAIGCKASFSFNYQTPHTPNNAKQGFDLYVKKDGKWYWAGNAASKGELGKETTYTIATGLDEGMKECIIYFPLGSIMTSFELSTVKGSSIERGQTPFKGRIAVFGSSFTQGAGSSRCAMTYSAQLSRMTGFNFINMGFSGQSKLQPYFAHALCKADDIDAYLFDALSNPSAGQIRDRLFPFIEIFQKEKPGVPLIFMKTIAQEKIVTHKADERSIAMKMHVSDSLMKIAVKKYDNVYYIDCTNATGPYNECTTDGVHPDQHGYTLWAESIRKPVVKILRKYGLR